MESVIRFVACAASAAVLACSAGMIAPSYAQSVPSHPITIHRDIDFVGAFAELGRLGGAQVRLAVDLNGDRPLWFVPQHVRLDEMNTPFVQALQDLIDMSGTPLKFYLINGVYVVERDRDRPVRPTARTVNVALNEPLGDAIASLFSAAGYNAYAWDPVLVKDKVPLRANGLILYKLDDDALKAKVDLQQSVFIQRNNTPLDDALKEVLADAQPPLTYSYEQEPDTGQPILLIKPDTSRPLFSRALAPAPPHEGTSHSYFNTTFEKALDMLFTFHGKYRIDPGVTASDEPVTFVADGVPFDTVLTTLLGSIKGREPLTYQIENGVYVILPAGPPDAVQDEGKAGKEALLPHGSTESSIESKPITLALRGTTLQNALKMVFAQIDTNYVYAVPKDDAENITLTLQNVPFKQALTSILRSTPVDPGLQSEVRAGMVTVAPRFRPDNRLGVSRLLVAHFHHADLYEATKALFTCTEGQFVIDPGLRNATVTAEINGLPLQDALQTLMRQSTRPVNIQIRDQVYYIGPR